MQLDDMKRMKECMNEWNEMKFNGKWNDTWHAITRHVMTWNEMTHDNNTMKWQNDLPGMERTGM